MNTVCNALAYYTPDQIIAIISQSGWTWDHAAAYVQDAMTSCPR